MDPDSGFLSWIVIRVGCSKVEAQFLTHQMLPATSKLLARSAMYELLKACHVLRNFSNNLSNTIIIIMYVYLFYFFNLPTYN